MIAAVAEPTEQRPCRGCGESLPSSKFRWQGTRRSTLCYECLARRARRRRYLRRLYRADNYLHRLAKDRDAEVLAAVCRAMLNQLQGIGGFVKVLDDLLQHGKSGSRTRSTMLCALLNLETKHAELRHRIEREDDERHRTAVSEMNLEELNRTIDDSLRRMLKSDPQLAVECARRLGWTVIPPAA